VTKEVTMSTENTSKEIEVREKQAVEQAHGEVTWEGRFFNPHVDIWSSEKGITILADLPGVAKDGLDIDLREGILTIVGKVAGQRDGFEPIRSEYEIGGYMRRFTISDEIDTEAIGATLKDGVLTLVLPKAARALPRKIAVHVN